MDIFYHKINDFIFIFANFQQFFFSGFLCMVQVGNQNIHKEASKKNKKSFMFLIGKIWLNELTYDQHLFLHHNFVL